MKQYSLEPANFRDYRDFLKSRFEQLQKKNKSYSVSALAKKSGVSKSLMQFVFQKKRHLGLDRLPQIAKALKLGADEEHFTYLMVCQSTSQNPSIQSHFENILNRIRHEHVTTETAEPTRSTTNDKTLYLDYLRMIMQTMVRLKGFKNDPAWIKTQILVPGITSEMVAAYLKELERSGFIFENNDGQLEAKSESLWRPDPYDPSGNSVFTAGANAIADLMRTPQNYRPSVYSSMALAMDEDNLLKAEKFMIDVHHQLCQFAKQSHEPTAAIFSGNYFLTVARQKPS